MIQYRKGNLLDNLTGREVIVHACNAQGVWGSGFAKQLKDKFPHAFREYSEFCSKNSLSMGRCCFASDVLDLNPLAETGWGGVLKVVFSANLITSNGYGQGKDNPDIILKNTRIALKEFFDNYIHLPRDLIVSPKFNSGLFGVPWEKTEAIIVELLPKQVSWVVWEI